MDNLPGQGKFDESSGFDGYPRSSRSHSALGQTSALSCGTCQKWSQDRQKKYVRSRQRLEFRLNTGA